MRGRGGGPVVSVLAVYYDYPSSNPAEGYIYSVKILFEINIGLLIRLQTNMNVLKQEGSFWTQTYYETAIS